MEGKDGGTDSSLGCWVAGHRPGTLGRWSLEVQGPIVRYSSRSLTRISFCKVRLALAWETSTDDDADESGYGLRGWLALAISLLVSSLEIGL